MHKKPLTILLILIALMWQTPLQAASRTVEINIYNGTRRAVEVSVEVAETYEERKQGLMHREALGKKEGMLFIVRDNYGWGIWMKDVLIPLDIIFISKDFRVINYVKDVKPCKASPCENYRPERPARYALEMNAGFIERYGIEEGSLIEIRE